ncbi:MAG: hypothetical protein JO127_17190 [Caulobacteraceae bacterium]|nr:hypothetical protein [Caulobacteraceae bacterium]
MKRLISARGADRLYGDLLILLAAVSAIAPLFAEATLAWALFAAGIAGVWWIALDRTVHGFLAAVGWTLVSLGLGLHLAFQIGVDVLPLEGTLAAGFILLGVSELFFGVERYRHRPMGRCALIVGAAVAIGFGIAVPLALPQLPDWLISSAVAVMLGAFGVGLLLGARTAGRNQRPGV